MDHGPGEGGHGRDEMRMCPRGRNEPFLSASSRKEVRETW